MMRFSLVVCLSLFMLGQANLSAQTNPLQKSRLVFHREGRIASVRPDGTDWAWHTDEFIPFKKMEIVYPYYLRVGPNRKRIAYGLARDLKPGIPVAEQVALHVLDLNGDHEPVDVSLTAYSWCWSPGGDQLAVGIVDDNGMTKNYLVRLSDLERTELKQLPKNQAISDWSSNGEWFLTKTPPSVPFDEKQIVIVKRDGSESRKIRAQKHSEAVQDGRFSPDGERILYETFNYETRRSILHTMDLATGEAQQVSPERNAQLRGACWSPTGEQIACIWRMNDSNPLPDQKAEYRLTVMTADGQQRRTLLKETGSMPSDGGATRLDWVTLSGLDW